MREALMLQLEKVCYYQHLSLSGGQERPIFAYRIVDIRGSRFHVLSRIQDAGLDFTGRTNFIAHHLVLAPEELRQSGTPPVILRDWGGWVKSWSKDPQLLEGEDWSSLNSLAAKTCVPAQTWKRVTGDAVNGYGLLEARAGASFRVDDQPGETILDLLAESLELLEVRDMRRDFRAAAWNYTFTTSMQEQDNPADFRWRCIHSDNPAANRFATPDCRALSDVRATKWTGEETAFARTGRLAPRFVAEPQDIRIVEGETARFQVKAEGVPYPNYQWFTVDRAGNGQTLSGETNPELVVSNPGLGLSRYVVRANNSAGDTTSKVATLSVEQKVRLAQVRADTELRGLAKADSYRKSQDDIERQRKRLQAEQAQELFQKRLRRNKIRVTVLTTGLIVVAGFFVWQKHADKKSVVIIQQPSLTSTNWSGSTTSAVVASLGTPSQTPPQSAVQSGDAENAVAPSDATPNSKPSTQKTMFQEDLRQFPAPWTYTNVGHPIRSQVPMTAGGTFTFTGRGKNFSGNTDNFFFASQPVSNSVEFIARLSKVSRETNECQCGIMLRESNKPDAPFVFLGISSTNIIWTQRPTSGVVCKSVEVSVAPLPIFLRLRRNTDLFIGEISTNGIDWNGGKTNKISMTESKYLLGFAVTSGKPALEVDADFDSITNHLTEAKP
jgi:hypothetical protein